ncbi:anti-anti-sigma factor [Georgenia satyanarayanai]|uniref:Anti-anti-sigma factor n=1 Tax=Georgenia satyanarayanai TaxID=860221 RepID=A0A2Y9AT75_9MICO|nr:STAS domain-containing protein [Georgenia satyanarayanai]PYF95944.1 anti-anti-sigma factor [Georgenia satyanarayanai]SSA47265.1 anti-anti-sigma factor [Georgenia satyanarayanai]
MAAHSQLPQPAAGTVTLHVSPDRVRLILRGELDMLMKTELLDAVHEVVLHDVPVEVDVRDVTFMDSSVLAALSRLIQVSKERPVFISPPPVVRFLLDVTRIGELVDIVGTDGEPLEPSTAEQGSTGLPVREHAPGD